MNNKDLFQFIDALWDDSILPRLIEYIAIPNKSPLFDPEWQENGYMDEAVRLAEKWCRDHLVEGAVLDVVRLPGRTPLLFLEIPGDVERNVLLYGHLDKQPEMTGWRDGLGPWRPIAEGDRLYGRGGADDGYALFASLTALLALRSQGLPHPRCVIVIECCEESGSIDLPFYIDFLADRIGKPDLVICLDSGCGNYDQFWCTTSLRGVVCGSLSVEILTEGVHSGDAGGIVPSSFRIARELLSRLENEKTGYLIPSECHAEIPSPRIDQAREAAAVLDAEVFRRFPFIKGAQPLSGDNAELILNRTWRPTLEVTGASGLPALADAGNVQRPLTALKLSMRLPPASNAQAVAAMLKGLLERDSPYGARVRFEVEQASNGWNAPSLSAELANAVESASLAFFGKPAMYMGEGGSIPFMAMLGNRFPEAQFLVTGVLGPHANAHGPNEFLHIPTAKRLTCCIAHVIAAMRH